MQVATEGSAQVMSYCKEEGKDRVIFVTKEDHEEPSKVASLLLDDIDDDEPGLINDDGSINWSCPCLGGMATGPCGPDFREAFSCFHYSTEEVKGSDCFEQFQAMQDCMKQYPSLYDTDKDERDEAEEDPFADEEKSNSKESDSKKTEDSGSNDDPSKDKSSSKESAKGKS